ncbi:MAG: DUF1311 domain-containing protein [Acidobacteriaceae bacterium]|nr:DUF1311 domain-containing protein [Acidobacteriaceae bacterium]
MKFDKLIFFSLSAFFAGLLPAQSGFSTTTSLSDGTAVWINTSIEPPYPAMGSSFVTAATGLPGEEGLGVRRYLYDKQKHVYFGYDILMRPEPGGVLGLTFRIAEQPPQDPALKGVHWTQLPAPLVPPKEERVKSGDTIVLDVFQNPSTGQKIVEHVRFERPDRLLCEAAPAGGEKLACLTAILEGLRETLNSALRQAEKVPTSAAAFQAARTQRSWERYEEEACPVGRDRSEQVVCEISLTRSRVRELTAALSEKH